MIRERSDGALMGCKESVFGQCKNIIRVKSEQKGNEKVVKVTKKGMLSVN